MTRLNLRRLVAAACLHAACLPCSGDAPPGRELPMGRPEWRLYLPAACAPRPEGIADLLVHFHGDPETVWRNAEEARLAAPVVTVNYPGLSSAYSTPFSDPKLFGALLDDALGRLRSDGSLGTEPRWGRLAVSSFSAGYGAVRELLKHPGYIEQIDGLLAADSLYASTGAGGGPLDEQMEGYRAFAARAARGEKTFVLTHTEVRTPTYESTRETADDLLASLGLRASAVSLRGRGSLVFARRAERGGFSLWGSPGDTGEAHLEHLRRMAEWLDDLPIERAPDR